MIKKCAPIIIIGMHRSGTSILAHLLEGLGVFLGARQKAHHESTFFQKLNRWMFRQVNATWDTPYNWYFLSPELERYLANVVKMNINSIRFIEYLGFKNFLTFRKPYKLNRPWGWKDPRNTFTVDIWCRIFPEAKILHIYRNPIDVAVSLRTREKGFIDNFQITHWKKIKMFWLTNNVGFIDSPKVLNLYEGILLWKEYVGKALDFGREKKMLCKDIVYEELLSQPVECLKEILDFLNINICVRQIIDVTACINPERRYAFLKDQELIKVYKEVKNDNLIKMLYDDIVE